MGRRLLQGLSRIRMTWRHLHAPSFLSRMKPNGKNGRDYIRVDVREVQHAQDRGTRFRVQGRCVLPNRRRPGHFTIVLDDPTDDSHIITFSGENGRKEKMICTNYRSTGCC